MLPFISLIKISYPYDILYNKYMFIDCRYLKSGYG